MGNTICNSKCGKWRKSKQTYVIILNRIYSITRQKSKRWLKISIHKSLEISQEKTRVSIEQELVLRSHVKNNIKALIDYLGSNHNKLPDTGKFVYKKASKSLDPEVHIVSLLVIKELLSNLNKFTYDQDLLCKLMGRRNESASIPNEEKKLFYLDKCSDENNEVGSSVDVAPPNNTEMKGNIIEFEGLVIELLYFILDQRRNPHCKIVPHNVLFRKMRNHSKQL